MNKVNKLLAQHGDEIRESLGQRKDEPLELVRDTSGGGKFAGRHKAKGASLIDIDQIVAIDQHRQNFDSDKLNLLADSLASTGQIQAVVVRYDDGLGKYVVIAGERRLRAAKIAGFTQLRCDVKDNVLTDEQIAEIQLAENCAREDLNPIERANAFHDTIRVFGCSANKLAKKIGVNQTTISRHLSLLKMPEETQSKVASGELSMSAAAEASRIKNVQVQNSVVESIVAKGLSRDEAVQQVSSEIDRSGSHLRRNRSTYATDQQFGLRGGGRVRIMSSLRLSDQDIIDELRDLLGRLGNRLGEA